MRQQKQKPIVSPVQDKEIMTEKLIQKKIFDEMGDDTQSARQMINGTATGILNLNSVKYSWAPKLYKIMVNNFWIPEKISLVDDKVTIKELTKDEMDNAITAGQSAKKK